MDITSILPEDCISNALSFTSPRDACSSALVSRIFGSAAVSDIVWNKFLPPDYKQIISESVSSRSSSSPSLNVLSKKDLYFHLCHNPILIGNGNRSFSIDKLSGKKCYMLGARELSIAWGDTPRYWKWISSTKSLVLPQSRFSEVALLRRVCWLDIRGRIETNLLSPNTRYGAYFVYCTLANDLAGFEDPVKVSSRFGNESEGDVSNAYLLSNIPQGQDGRLPSVREDMWLEIEIGEFFNAQIDSVIKMRLWETEVLHWKCGLVVHGIELRPKQEIRES